MISMEVLPMFGEIEMESLAMDTWITNVIQTIGPHAVLNISPDKISPVLRKLAMVLTQLTHQLVNMNSKIPLLFLIDVYNFSRARD